MSFQVTQPMLDAGYVEEWRRSNLAFSKNAALAIVFMGTIALYLIPMWNVGQERTADYLRENQEYTMRGTVQ